MKTKHIILIASLLCLVTPAGNTGGAEADGTFKFVNVDVPKVLETYQAATGLKLVTASNVAQAHGKITLRSKGATTASEAARQMARALLEQAGVVITQLDNGLVSVTYNDALKISPPRSFPAAK